MKGMRRNHAAERDVLRKQLDQLYRDHYEAEEQEWFKVVDVLMNNQGQYLTSSEIAAKAKTELTVDEIRANMIYNSQRCTWDGYHFSHSSVLNAAINKHGAGTLERSAKTVRRRFVEVGEDGEIIPSSVIERTRTNAAFTYKPNGTKRRG